MEIETEIVDEQHWTIIVIEGDNKNERYQQQLQKHIEKVSKKREK
jgi:hypothetical protein